MPRTYTQQLAADEAAINAEAPAGTADGYHERAGRFSVLAHYYAASADVEAAKAQAMRGDPKWFVSAFFATAPNSQAIANLIKELKLRVMERKELSDCALYLDDARDQAQFVADAERAAEGSDCGICATCNGSGEGQHDGAGCRTCGGSGECAGRSERDKEDHEAAMLEEARRVRDYLRSAA